MTDTPTVVIKTNTEIRIKVTLNVRLTASVVSKLGTNAVIKVTYEKVLAGQTITELGVVWGNVI